MKLIVRVLTECANPLLMEFRLGEYGSGEFGEFCDIDYDAGTSVGPVASHRSSGCVGAASFAKVTPSLAPCQDSFAVGKCNDLPFRARSGAPVWGATVKQLLHSQKPLCMLKQILSMSRNIEVRCGHCGLI